MKSIKSKLMAAILIPLLLVGICPIICIIIYAGSQIHKEGFSSANSIVVTNSANVDGWIQTKRDLLEGYTKQSKAVLRNILRTNLGVQTGNLYDLYYGDLDGKTYSFLNSPEEYLAENYDPRTRDWYKEAMVDKNRMYISEPYKDALTSDVVLTFSKALVESDSGVLAADLTIDTIGKEMKSIVLPVKGNAYLLYGDDNKIIASTEQTDLFDKPLASIDSNLSFEFVNQVLKDREVGKFSEITFQDGSSKFIIGKKLNNAPWNFVIILDKSVYYSNAYWTIGIIVLITVFICIASYMVVLKFLRKGITEPVDAVASYLRVLAEQRNDVELNDLQVTTDDEIGDLISNFNLFLENQRVLFEQIQGFISISANESVENNRAIAEKIEDQKNALSEVVSAMDTIGASIDQINCSVSNATSIVVEVEDASQHGANMAAQTSSSISELSSNISQTSEAIKKVSEYANSISSVISTIQNIAEQTNLLALNAAIESARAGEHGRGFAVVADEVRNLSIKTSESTKEIQETIETLQKNVADTVILMERSNISCEQSLECVNNVSSSITTILDIVNRITATSENIRVAAEEQNSIVSQTSTKVLQVNETNTSLIETIQLCKDSSENLIEKSEELSKKIILG